MRAMPWACGGVGVPLWRVFSPGLGPDPPERGRGRRINGVKADENVFGFFFALLFISLFQVHRRGEQAFPFKDSFPFYRLLRQCLSLNIYLSPAWVPTPHPASGLRVGLGAWVETLQAENRRYLRLQRELLVPPRVVEFIKKIALPYGFPSLKGLSLRGCCVQGIGLAQCVCVMAKRVQ